MARNLYKAIERFLSRLPFDKLRTSIGIEMTMGELIRFEVIQIVLAILR